MLRSVERAASALPVQKGVFSLQDLQRICEACNLLPDPVLFRALYLTAFFGFFRISNLVPATRLSFDVKKQLCVGDILFEKSYTIILVKWSKSIQLSTVGTFIVIPHLGGNPLCRSTALKRWVQLRKAHSATSANSPLFGHAGLCISQPQVRAHLARVLRILHLQPVAFPFHTFRRSGATLAFNANVGVQHIKRHGTWSSDAVQAYLIEDPLHASGVAQTFTKMFHQ